MSEAKHSITRGLRKLNSALDPLFIISKSYRTRSSIACVDVLSQNYVWRASMWLKVARASKTEYPHSAGI
jgi:hypothetical protein